MEKKNVLALMFDLSFSDFVTTRVVKVLFIIGVVMTGIGTLLTVVAGFAGGFASGFIALILAPVWFLLGTFLSRIYCELIIVVFRIAENTSIMAKQQSGL